MPFEKFERNTGPSARISLRKSGSIGLNSTVINEYFEGYDYAVLYYDNDEQRVGIEPKKKESKDTYKVQKRDEENQGGSIHAKSFMREFQLIPDNTTQYNAKYDEDLQIVYIGLENPVLVYDN